MSKKWKLPLLIVSLIIMSVVIGSILAYLGAENTPDKTVRSSQSSQAEDAAKIAERRAKEEAERKRVEINVENLVKFTNEERVKANLLPLVNNPLLNQSAQNKANDMASRNYWSHNTPDGIEPWSFILNTGYSYRKAGENLGCGFNSSTELIEGWMKSPSHRQNILKPEYTEVGFGIVPRSDNYDCGSLKPVIANIVVQHFATPY